jgi:hypothetical protein
MNRLFTLLAAIVILGCFGIEVAACDCILPDPKEALTQQVNNARRSSRAVFSGEVLKIERAAAVVLVTFRVDTVWKGTFPRTLVITTGTDDCGYGFRLGERYLVYAIAWPNTTDFYTSICSRTAVFSQATADVQLLGKPRRWRT